MRWMHCTWDMLVENRQIQQNRVIILITFQLCFFVLVFALSLAVVVFSRFFCNISVDLSIVDISSDGWQIILENNDKTLLMVWRCELPNPIQIEMHFSKAKMTQFVQIRPHTRCTRRNLRKCQQIIHRSDPVSHAAKVTGVNFSALAR